MLVALSIVNFDHSPLLLKPKPPLTNGSNFKYEAFWEENEKCRLVVANSWNEVVNQDSKWKPCVLNWRPAEETSPNGTRLLSRIQQRKYLSPRLGF